jgi:predicted HicB family RNase H-like nuclease
MKKQSKRKADNIVRATVRINRDVWSAARHAALDRGTSFGQLVEDALRAYLGVK